MSLHLHKASSKSNNGKDTILMNFRVDKDFYKLYKISSQRSGKTMKTILFESFRVWCNGD